jgi:hypothetical protein
MQAFDDSSLFYKKYRIYRLEADFSSEGIQSEGTDSVLLPF